VWGRFTRPRRLVETRREALVTPDGDELLVDHLDAAAGNAAPSGAAAGAPRVILLHGLEGSSNSVYVQGFLAVARRLGLAATALNFRSCARDPDDLDRMLMNRLPRLYHSGETTDLDFVVRTLAARAPDVPLAAVGVSLGGNVLLKWLGENPGQRLVSAAATLSTPYDLAAGSRYLEGPLMGRLYVAKFLKTLRPKAIDIVARFPETASRIDLARLARAKTFWELDDAATGPLHGFAGADDYYARSSSLRVLGRIAIPTLCISAKDDPFLPAHVLEEVARVASPAVTLVATERGGHVGFVAGARPKSPVYWAEELAVSFVASRSLVASRL